MGCAGSKEGDKYEVTLDGMGCIALGWEKMMRDKTGKLSVMTGHWEVSTDRIDNDHHVSLGEGGFGLVYVPPPPPPSLLVSWLLLGISLVLQHC